MQLQRAVIGIALAVQFLAPARVDSTQAVQPSASQQEGETGNDLLRACADTVHLLDRDSQLADTEMWSAFHCSGYVAGFVDGYVLAEDMEYHRVGSSHPLFCVREGGLVASQEVRIFVKWLRDHPERLHESGRVLLTIALEQAFPCK